MKLLVTGGAGFIGSNFINYWISHHPKDFVINLDILTYAGNLENLKNVAGSKNYKFVKGDICDKSVVDKLVKSVDIIVHFAAESHVDRSIMDATPFVITNVLGTQVLLDAALRYQKRFHHVSTDEVFGDLELNAKEKFSENTPYNPHSPYSASKAASDHLVRSYFYTHKLPVTISNCSNNYGPYQYPEKFIPVAITNLLEGKKVPVYGKGLNVRDWLYVMDHCKAIDLIIHRGKMGETYCIGGQKQQEYSNMAIVRMILKILGKKEKDWIEFVKDRPGHDQKYAVSWKKIHTQLGWKPEYDMEKGLKNTVEWYESNSSWWRKLKKSNGKH